MLAAFRPRSVPLLCGAKDCTAFGFEGSNCLAWIPQIALGSRVLRERVKALQDNTVAAPRHFHSFRQWNEDLLPLHFLPDHGFSFHIRFDRPRMQRYPCPDLLNFPFNQRFPQIPPTLSYGLFRTQNKIITNLFRDLSPIGDILSCKFLRIRGRILAGLFCRITRSLLICLPPQSSSVATLS